MMRKLIFRLLLIYEHHLSVSNSFSFHSFYGKLIIARIRTLSVLVKKLEATSTVRIRFCMQNLHYFCILDNNSQDSL